MKLQTNTFTTYVANDGTVFSTANECKAYEHSKLPLYVQIIVEQDFMYYNHSYNELHLALGEESNQVENEVKTYTQRIIHDVFEMQKMGKTLNEIMVEFGLVIK